MDKVRPIDRTQLQALKISEIHSDTTDFDLFLDHGGLIVPYAKGLHRWSVDEKEQLLEAGQYVVLYADADHDQVARYLHSVSGERQAATAEALIADGTAEFLKTAYAHHANSEQAHVFKTLAASLVSFLREHPVLSKLLQDLAQHDLYSFYHSARVAAYAVGIHSQVEAHNYARLWDITIGALLHDVGNLSIDAQLLQRAGPLDEREWALIRHHPEESWRLLQDEGLSPGVKEIVLHHHERLDAGGYPHRLPASELPVEVRMVSLAEVFAALVQPRPYQASRTIETALQLIESSLLNFLDAAYVGPLRQFLGYADAGFRHHAS